MPQVVPRRSQPARPGLLHQLGGLLSLPHQARLATGLEGRRRRQRLALAQRLLNPLPQGLKSASDAEQFWTLLRWGGAGMLLAWLLHR